MAVMSFYIFVDDLTDKNVHNTVKDSQGEERGEGEGTLFHI